MTYIPKPFKKVVAARTITTLDENTNIVAFRSDFVHPELIFDVDLDNTINWYKYSVVFAIQWENIMAEFTENVGKLNDTV